MNEFNDTENSRENDVGRRPKECSHSLSLSEENELEINQCQERRPSVAGGELHAHTQKEDDVQCPK